MDSRGPLADYLTARRGQLQPEDVGLPRDPGRRVEGLRRSEVAQLAGISVDYYLRMERGRDRQPSAQVLGALARALRLDEEAIAYLRRIAIDPIPCTGQPDVELRREVRDMLGHWDHAPAYVSDAHHDIIAVNAVAELLAPSVLVPGRNLVLDVFQWAEPIGDDGKWEETAARLVSSLRYHADPDSPRLREILGNLGVTNRVFRRMWAQHDARPQTAGVGVHLIEGHGWVEMNWLTLDVPGAAGHHLTTFYADAGSPGAAALESLVSQARRNQSREGSLAMKSARVLRSAVA